MEIGLPIALLIFCASQNGVEGEVPSTPAYVSPHSEFPSTPSPVSAEKPVEEYAFEVTVRGERADGKDSSASVGVVGGDEIRKSARPTALEAVSQEVSGVYVSGRGVGFHGVASGASGGISIRGLGGSPNTQVVMIEDGVPDYQGIFGHPIPDAYIPTLIERVEVIKGGDSVLYGTNALGGVIYTKNRWRKEEGSELFLDSGYGSYETFRQTAAFLTSYGEWDAVASFNGVRSDGHRDGAGGENIIGQMGARWRATEDLRFTLRNKLISLNGGDPGPTTHPYLDHWYKALRNNASFSAEYFAPKFYLSSIAFINYGDHKLYDGFHSDDYLTGIITEGNIRLLDSLRLLLGVSGDSAFGDVENRISGERFDVEGSSAAAFYNQLTFAPLSRLLFTAGTRELYNTSFGPLFLYKVGGRWEFVEGFFLRSRYVTNYRQPTIRERYLPFPVANPKLDAEFSRNLDIGIMALSRRFESDLSVYRTSADNLIRYFGAYPAAEVVNIDHIVFWGVDGYMKLKELWFFSLFLGGNWQDVGRYTKQNPSSKFNFGVEFSRQPFRAEFTGELVKGLYQNNYERDAISDVFYMDLSGGYTFYLNQERQSLELYGVLRNISDNEYEYIKGYPMPGFNALFGLKLSL
ncbi:MAG: TonB-dependent receptor [Myxococcota bacterium]